MSDNREIQRGYRLTWWLILLSACYVVGFFSFNYYFNAGIPTAGWDLDDIPIVPASSINADGYYAPVENPEWLEVARGRSR